MQNSTPLAAILGWARLLQTRSFDPETTARALETLERNATSEAKLVKGLLDVSSILLMNSADPLGEEG
ncbi:MAG: hypothetical protein KME12_23345 [Trichocoleus desertorum ATA4-8-CV12]|nr:hypothetical protein [Trichocoleus desertorum ATA4-8-CV12]